MKKGVNRIDRVFSLRAVRRVGALVLALLMLLPANLATVLAEAVQGEAQEGMEVIASDPADAESNGATDDAAPPSCRGARGGTGGADR